MRALLSIPLAFAIAVLVGCSGDSAEGTLNGTVTFDGQPLKTGLVVLTPTDGKGQPTDAVITDGKFTVKVKPGEVKLAFSSSKAGKKVKMYDTPDSPTVDEVIELLPEKHNKRTIWKTTIKGGVQDETYALTSK